ncbi:MAG: hypothetical protein ABIA04_09365 [Pseudomonadota bacterium]
MPYNSKVSLFVYLLFSTIICANPIFAIDEEGCLICHKYPGIVALNQKEQIKALHIDELLYSKTKHGKFKCGSCHIDIKEIPHTGYDKITCINGNCHNQESINELTKKLPFKNFHKKQQSYLLDIKKETSCLTCHGIYPHKENKKTRAYINLHTVFMSCETCHIKQDKHKNLVYKWKNFNGVKFFGTSFASYYNPQIKSVEKNKEIFSIIDVFEKKSNKLIPLSHMTDNPEAVLFLINSKTIKNSDKKKELEYFHRNIRKNKASSKCDECHSNKSILNYKELGFDKKKTNNLINLELKNLVSKYDKFYFPDLLNR